MVLCSLCLYGSISVAVIFLLRYVLGKVLTVGELGSRAVFITGCDTGFGQMLAIKCTKNGMRVFAGCLTQTGAENLRKQTSTMSGILETVELDVTNQESVDKAAQIVKQKLGTKGLWGLVNNAGIAGMTGMDDFVTVENYQQLLDVNTLGVIRSTQAFKPLVKRAKGRIVTVASVLGRTYAAGAGPYVMSKYAVEAYCDCLRLEMIPFKVSVHILEPGVYRTNLTDPDKILANMNKMWEKVSDEVRRDYGEDYPKKMAENIPMILDKFASPRVDYVVDAYYHALTSMFPWKRYYVGWDALLFFVPLSMLPTSILDFILIQMAKYTHTPQPRIATLN